MYLADPATFLTLFIQLWKKQLEFVSSYFYLWLLISSPKPYSAPLSSLTLDNIQTFFGVKSLLRQINHWSKQLAVNRLIVSLLNVHHSLNNTCPTDFFPSYCCILSTKFNCAYFLSNSALKAIQIWTSCYIWEPVSPRTRCAAEIRRCV